MEKLLIQFINTLDGSLKKVQRDAGSSTGVSKLTISQFQYIDAIDGLGYPTITDIANRLNITKASVTTGINRLVALGYVVKTQSEEDKRVFHVSLSEAGGGLVQAKYQALKEYEEFILSALSEEETRQFEGILAKLVERFKVA
jgi:DNA-binding MarR family transcriptional regulator